MSRNNRKNPASPGPAGQRTDKAGPFVRKKIWVAALCLFLLAALTAGGLLLFLPRGEVYSMGSATLDIEMYHFWFASLKSKYMELYGIRGTQDTAAFWASPCTRPEAGGSSWGDFLTAKIDGEIRAKLTAAALFDRTGEQVGASERAEIEAYLENEIHTAGGTAAFTALTEKYKTSANAIKKCALLEKKANKLYSFLYGKDVPAADKDAFYRALYTRVKVLYFKKFQDVSKAEKVYQAKEVLNEALGKEEKVSEETFDKYVALSDVTAHEQDRAPYGLYLYAGFAFPEGAYPDAVAEKLLSVQAGELAHIADDGGDWYILGYELDPGAYDREENKAFFSSFYFSAAQWSYNKFIAAQTSGIRVNSKNRAAIPDITQVGYCAEILRFLP